jgi:hypothetical protein
MRITKHEKSYIVELSDMSAWRVWPGDMAYTLHWFLAGMPSGGKGLVIVKRPQAHP